MTTLDKIPTDDLDQCRGMWVESTTGTLGIIRKAFYSVKRHSYLAQVLWPALDNAGGANTFFTPLDSLTLRDDLPRAWEANGKPTQ